MPANPLTPEPLFRAGAVDTAVAMEALRASVEFSNEVIQLLDLVARVPTLPLGRTGIARKMQERVDKMRAFADAISADKAP